MLERVKAHPNFQCFAGTWPTGVKEGRNEDIVWTEQGYIITAKDVVEATCVPLQDPSMLAELSYSRTYCIVISVPKGSVEDCLIYDTVDPYKYVRVSACDDNNDYLIIGGCDRKVGHEDSLDRFEILETWAHQRFTHAGAVDYRWSGQILDQSTTWLS